MSDIKRSALRIVKADITTLDVDCIVNAANAQLRCGGGVCGAVFQAAGAAELQAACNRIGGCPTGSAVITPGFRLKAPCIIHAVGPVWKGGSQGEASQLADCYTCSLELARQNGIHAIAFPLISSGIYGYPKHSAWRIALESILRFLSANPDYPLDVSIAVLDDQAAALGSEVLGEFALKKF